MESVYQVLTACIATAALPTSVWCHSQFETPLVTKHSGAQYPRWLRALGLQWQTQLALVEGTLRKTREAYLCSGVPFSWCHAIDRVRLVFLRVVWWKHTLQFHFVATCKLLFALLLCYTECIVDTECITDTECIY